MTFGTAYRHSGTSVAMEYLNRVTAAGIPVAELTAAADASPDLTRFHGRFMPNPVFLGADDAALLGRQVADIHDLLVAVPQRRFAGGRAEYGRMLGLSEFQLAIVESAPRQTPPPLARADLYRTDTGFALLELNVGSALGGFECGEINQAMTSHPILADFVREKQLGWVDTAQSMLGTAVAVHAERSGVAPTVALVDWPDTFAKYQPILELMARLCRRSGVEVLTCHLGELRETADGLSCRGRHIDIVYRFFLLEYVDSAAAVELLEPLIRAQRSGAVTLLSPLDADIYGYKEGLALLSEMVHGGELDDRERESVTSLVPWTRRLRTTIDDPAGEPVDALHFAIAQQSELILKPVSLHGGTGIVAGWTVEAEQWRRCLQDSLGGPYIIQQRVRPVPDPVLVDRRIGQAYCNWGVFLARPTTTGPASYCGCIIRASLDPEVDVISYDNEALLGGCLVGP